MTKPGVIFTVLLALGLVGTSSAMAEGFRLGHKNYGYELVQSYDDVYNVQYEGNAVTDDGYGNSELPVSPSQAARIAKKTWPGSKVLRVQLLPSGEYAVTLKQGGEVSRVRVDGTSGSIN
jgi:uncharacterized membrane protein YkoI